MVEFFSAAIDMLGLVGYAFSFIWQPLFMCAFIVVVVDTIFYYFMGGDR